MSQQLTYFEKVWRDHVVSPLEDGGALIHIDRLVLHEWTAQWILPGFRRRGLRPARPDLVFTLVDHLIDTMPGRGPEQCKSESGTQVLREARANIRDLQ